MSDFSVLFVLPTLKQAGAETQAVDLAIEMDQYARCAVATLSDDIDLAFKLDQANVTWHAIPRKSKFDLSVVRKLSDLITKEDYSTIQCTNQFTYLLVSLACRAIKFQGKIVVTLHTTKNVSTKDEVLDRLLYSHLLTRASKCVFVCKAQMDYWLQKFPKLTAKSAVIHNGVDVDFFNPNAGFAPFSKPPSMPEGELTITCIAAFRTEKRHDLLLSTFAKLPDSVNLLLAGSGPLEEEILHQIAELGVQHRVSLLGQVQDVRPLLEYSDLTILTSTAVETFSIAMLESMAMGVPMVSPDIGGAKEAIEHGVTGYLYPIGDSASLFDILSEISSNPAVLKVVGDAAQAKVRKQFTKSGMVSNYKEIMQESRN